MTFARLMFHNYVMKHAEIFYLRIVKNITYLEIAKQTDGSVKSIQSLFKQVEKHLERLSRVKRYTTRREARWMTFQETYDRDDWIILLYRVSQLSCSEIGREVDMLPQDVLKLIQVREDELRNPSLYESRRELWKQGRRGGRDGAREFIGGRYLNYTLEKQANGSIIVRRETIDPKTRRMVKEEI